MEIEDNAQIRRPISQRWFGRLGMLLLTVAFLTGAFAPVNQFYLGWIGLVPWLIVLAGTRSQRSAFFWSWIGGTLFFIANMWWMAKVTVPGMIALMAVLGLYWGVAGMILRGAGLLSTKWSLLRCVLIAAVWVSVGESFRGTWPWNGLPWLYLGYTQSPVLAVCQIADITGVLGVSFIVALVNAWIAMWMLNGRSMRGLKASGVSIGVIVAVVIGYGFFRMGHESLTTGPKVLVVQPNYPQDNATGAKGAEPPEMLSFHARTTEAELQKGGIDLTVWSETIMPALNPEAAMAWSGWNVGTFINDALIAIHDLGSKYHSAFLVGAEFEKDFSNNAKGIPEPADKRNSAYFFDRGGDFTKLRYDKIHLVPFGEFIPFKTGCPPLFRLMVNLGPEDMKSYFLQPGSEDQLTVFSISQPGDDSPWRFVTPICFEDIDPALCAKMFHPDPSNDKLKRADFLVNITNDGWFLANENYQHFQAAIFRSIENRVPSARSVNTGISGFIDPLGRTSGLLPARSEGASVSVLQLDSRITFFTRHGQLFAWICAMVTALTALVSLLRWKWDRETKRRMPAT